MPNADAKPIDLFRAGTRTAMSGEKVTITAADLAASAAAYDPALRPAPLVIGHPKIEDPAYGWVKELTVDGDRLRAVPEQVEAGFAGLVNDGRYRNVSAEFYKPDSPSNPKPGVWYLKHIGFLGAAPPAVEGLKPVSFAAGGDDSVAFAWSDRTAARLFRSLREWMLGTAGQETTDRVLPSWDIDQLQEDAVREAVLETPSSGLPAFAAPDTVPPKKEPAMPTPNEALQPAEKAELERLRSENASFAAAAKTRREAEDKSFLDRMVAEARVPAGHRDQVAAFLARLDDGETVAFAGEGQPQQSERGWFQGFLAGLKPTVAFGEETRAGGTVREPDQQALIVAARKYQAAMAEAGETVSWAAAVEHASKESAHA